MSMFKKNPSRRAILLIAGILIFSVFLAWLLFFSEKISEPKKPVAQSTTNTKQKLPAQPSLVLNESNNRNVGSLTTETIWKKLLAGFQNGEKVQVELENELIERLRNEPDSPVYQELLSLFRQGSLEGFAQQVLVSLLGEVENFKSAETLMNLVNEALLNEPDVQWAASNAIRKFSPESWHEHSNAEFAPVFEAAWRTDNSNFWLPIANVMATIGTPSTLDIFIKTLTDNTDPKRVEIVKRAMTDLTNPALIPKLADSLENSKTETVQLTSGETLANMGNIEAASTLVDWSSQADAGKVGLVKTWFETAMNTTPEFIDYLETNLAGQKFAAPEVKQAVSAVLAEVKNEVDSED